MEPIITISNLSKKYSLSKAVPYVALRDVITNSIRKLFSFKKEHEIFWALKEIDLEVHRGERLGIIGHNGAGKSTLLKIISRITPPTTGRIVLNGRVASLLEVGTGFHPGLTGRENIYLNGSVLGLKKKEIDFKLDEIIDFSGVEAFIDIPLKNYSSGMQLRLAFSVAAHLEPEILLIDEVLAVGDVEFQKKCIGKMEEVSKANGRTILFVSHNMASIKQLCTKGLVLEKGKVAFYGMIDEATNHYTRNTFYKIKKNGIASYDLREHDNKVSREEGLLTAQMFVNGILSDIFIPGAELKIKMQYFLNSPLIDPDIGIVIKDAQHNALIGLNNKHIGTKLSLLVGNRGTAIIEIPMLNIFQPGIYRVDLYFGDYYRFYECLYDAIEFTVLDHDVYESAVIPDPVWNKIFIPGIRIFTNE